MDLADLKDITDTLKDQIKDHKSAGIKWASVEASFFRENQNYSYC